MLVVGKIRVGWGFCFAFLLSNIYFYDVFVEEIKNLSFKYILKHFAKVV